VEQRFLNVLAVFKDGDNGVYKHAGKGSEALKNVEKNHSSENTSAGGENMGETEHEDEFINPENGRAMTETRIQYGTTWDPIIKKMAESSEGMDLTEVMLNSLPGGDFDVKVKYEGVGSKLNGKYASSRSAGNYAAGQNAALAHFGIKGVKINYDGFQNLAGALHKGGKWGLAKTVLYGKKWGKAPLYGEILYQYRMSKAGWESTGR
jgi:hypothetical protein